MLSFATLVFGLYSTYVYQTGLADLLYSKFRGPFWALTIYFLLSVSHHIWIVFNYEQMPHSFQWPTPLTALFIIQRLCKLILLLKNLATPSFVMRENFTVTVSPIYYYLYKRSALRLSDPRFYENMEWINERLSIK